MIKTKKPYSSTTGDGEIYPGTKFIIKSGHSSLVPGTIVETIQTTKTNVALCKIYDGSSNNTYTIHIGVDADFLDKTREHLQLQLDEYVNIIKEINKRIEYMDETGVKGFNRNEYRLWAFIQEFEKKNNSKKELFEAIRDIIFNQNTFNIVENENHSKEVFF